MMVLRAPRGAQALAASIVLVALGIGGILGLDRTWAAPASQTLYVSTGGRNSNPCTQAAPCASFARAYQVAKPGDVVQVAGGSYPAQSLPYDATKTSSADVVFQPAAGASVSLGGFASGDYNTGLGAKHFELQSMRIAGEVRILLGTEDVVLRSIDAASLNLTSTRNVQVLGGDWGPSGGISHIKSCGSANPACFPAEDILIDGAYFHDYTITDPANHAECLMIWPARRVTIRNSTFRNCTDFDILVKPGYDLTIENSFFDEPMPGNTATASCNPGCPRGGNALAFSEGSGVVVRYSSLLGGIRVDPEVSNVVLKANVGRQRFCQANASFSFNVWSGTRCSANDRVALLSEVFVDGSSAAFNLQLKPTSPALAAGDAADHPVRDIARRLRPASLAPDAGAWQREPALVAPGRAVGSVLIGMRREDVIAFYGPARKRPSQKLANGVRIDVGEHKVRGGKLRVSYRDDAVVAIATTSLYYRTIKGLTPGATLKARPNDDWTCRPVGASKGKARLYVLPTRSKKPVVAELIVVAPRFEPPCATASKGR